MIGLLFEHPGWLGPSVLWLVIIATMLAWAALRGRRNVRRLLGNEASRASALRRQAAIRIARDAALLTGLLFLAISLLGPRIGRETVQLSTSGVDVVVLIDTSRSMDARDVPPSRMAAARRSAGLLLDGLGPGDRAALAVHAGRGVLLTPLTSDHAALVEMVSAIKTNLVRPGGSNLPAGIEASLQAFEPVDERPRVVFVLTDGESPGYPVEDAATLAVRSNTRVFAAGFGTRAGATIPDHGVPLRDSEGRVVETALRLGSLETLTQRTGGELMPTDEWGQFDVVAAIDAIGRPVAGAPGEFVAAQVTVPSVIPFALAAALLLWLEWMPWNARSFGREARRRVPWLQATATSALALVLLGADHSGETMRSRGVASAEALLRAGLDHAARGAWAEAEVHFREAALSATDPELSAIAFHDLGVSALRQRRFEKARTAFFEALAATTPASDPARVVRTQWNLEFALIGAASTEQRPQESALDLAGMPGEKRQKKRPTQDRDGRGEPSPSRAARSEDHPARRGTAIPDLDAQQRRSWLARIPDDPRRPLVSAAFEDPEERRRRPTGEPTW